MSLKRHRRQPRTARQPLKIQFEGRVLEIGEPIMYFAPSDPTKPGRIVYPWRLTPRQRRRTIDHAERHAPPGPPAARGYHRRLRSRRGRAWRNRRRTA